MRARGSERVPLKIPVRIQWKGSSQITYTMVVNRGGALVMTPLAYPPEAILTIRNLKTGGIARVRVVWCGDEEEPGRRRMGVAILEEKLSFWGPDYEQSLPTT